MFSKIFLDSHRLSSPNVRGTSTECIKYYLLFSKSNHKKKSTLFEKHKII